MNYSGLLVIARENRFDETMRSLAEIKGVEVHQTDRASGRLIAVIEAETVDEETKFFNQIRNLPSVVDVSLVTHHFE